MSKEKSIDNAAKKKFFWPVDNSFKGIDVSISRTLSASKNSPEEMFDLSRVSPYIFDKNSKPFSIVKLL